MEFLNIEYTILEIYPKEENPSNDEDINDNSQWINVSKKLIEEGENILSGDLNEFIEKIKQIFIRYTGIIKTNLSSKYDEDISKEFDNCFIDTEILTKIKEFISKYDKDNEYNDHFGVLFNIITITDYIIEHIPFPEKMAIQKFNV